MKYIGKYTNISKAVLFDSGIFPVFDRLKNIPDYIAFNKPSKIASAYQLGCFRITAFYVDLLYLDNLAWLHFH